MKIHILRDGKQFGPYTQADVREYLGQGSLSPTDLAWHDGLENWITLSQIVGPAKSRPLPFPPSPGGSAPRTGFKLNRFWTVRLLFGLIFLTGLYISSPYYAAYSLRGALVNGNQNELANDIDFYSVRASLKAGINQSLSGGSGSLYGTIASFALRTGLDNAITFYFTPAGLASLAIKPHVTDPGTPDLAGAAKSVVSGMLGLNGAQPKWEGFESLDDFVIEESQAKLHLHFYGWGWKLVRIELEPNFDLQALTEGSP